MGKIRSFLFYGVELWGPNLTDHQRNTVSTCIGTELRKLAGALKSTPLITLCHELRIPPTQLYIDYRIAAFEVEDSTSIVAPWTSRMANVFFVIPSTKDDAFIRAASLIDQYDICFFPDGSVREDKSAYGIHVASRSHSW